MSRPSSTAAKGPTRRLPTWMSASPTIVKSKNVTVQMECTAGSVDVPRETDEQFSTVRAEDESQRRCRMKSDEHEKFASAGIGRRKRGRKLKSSEETETHDGDNDMMSNCGKNDEGRRKCQVQFPRRRRNVKVNSQVDGASDTTSLHDDEIELTVEDLVTIAEEYIKSYDDALRPHGESTLECGGRSTAPENANGSHNSASARTKKSSEGVVPGRGKAIEDLSNEVFAGAANKSVDPARKMLDLLLGPLLKKSPWDEKTSGLVFDAMNAAPEI